MKKSLTIVLFIVLVTLLFTSLFKTEKRQYAELQSYLIADSLISKKEYLTVVVDNNIAGVFTMNENLYGYQYELISEFAKYLRKPVKFVYNESLKATSKSLKDSEVDFVITTSDYSDRLHAEEVNKFNSSLTHNYVVLQKKTKNSAEDISELKSFVSDGEVVMTKPFVQSEAYDEWLDNVSNSAIVSSLRVEQLIKGLMSDEFETLVCDAYQAKLAMLKHDNLSVIYSFESGKSSSIYVDDSRNRLESLFLGWYSEFSRTEKCAELKAIYHGDNFNNFAVTYGYLAQSDYLISPYDAIFKEIAEIEGKDWKFLSAIAYNESRFRVDAVSKKGAFGIMQIMPRTAELFDVNIDEAYNPKTNVFVAVKLLNKIEGALRFKTETSEYDRKCIVLAAYNAGIGHVLDARRLAKKHDKDADSWSVVSEYLELKSSEEYVNDDSVKRGRCKSGETLAFVSNVMTKYEQYNIFIGSKVRGNNLAALQ